MKNVKNTIKESILKRLENTQCKPKARWRFIAKRAALWVPGFLAVMTGALSISVAIFSFVNSGWRFHRITHDSFLDFFVGALPYMWIVLTVVFLAVAIHQLRRTDRGYRYRLPELLLGSILLSIVLGVLIFMFGLGARLDVFATKMMPLHHGVIDRIETTWQAPEKGRLIGVVSPIDAYTASLVDSRGVVWTLFTEEAIVRGPFSVEAMTMVRVLGFKQQDKTLVFTACAIFPLLGGGGTESFSSIAHRRDKQARITHEQLQKHFERNSGELRSTDCRDLLPLPIKTR
jgi:hypothetical protein